jgi:hypothetical protein
MRHKRKAMTAEEAAAAVAAYQAKGGTVTRIEPTPQSPTPVGGRMGKPLKSTGERTYAMGWRRCAHCSFAYEPRQIGQRFCGDVCAAAWHEDAGAAEREDQRVGEGFDE